MVKLKRLKIDQFRNVAPGTELHFRDSLNVLLGKNGTGKTTLLNLITAVLSGSFNAFQDEAFSLEYELMVAQGGMTVQLRNRLLATEYPSLEEQDLAASKPPSSYSPEAIAFGVRTRYNASCSILFHLKAGDRKYLLKVNGTDGVLQEVGGSQEFKTSLLTPLLDGALALDVLVWLRQLSREKAAPTGLDEVASLMRATRMLSGLQRFDESLGYLDELTRSKDLFRASYGGRYLRVYPGVRTANSITQRLWQELEASSTTDRLVLGNRDAEMGFLERAVSLLGFASGEVRLQRTAREVGETVQIDFGDLQFYFVRRDGSEIDGSRLSYGQKRLLSFCYYLDCSSVYAVADELVNGMHHEVL